MTTLTLPAELTIYQMLEVKQLMIAAVQDLNEASSLDINLSEVSLCDGAGIQILISFFIFLRSKKITVADLALNSYLEPIFDRYNVKKYLCAQPEEIV